MVSISFIFTLRLVLKILIEARIFETILFKNHLSLIGARYENQTRASCLGSKRTIIIRISPTKTTGADGRI